MSVATHCKRCEIRSNVQGQQPGMFSSVAMRETAADMDEINITLAEQSLVRHTLAR